MASDKSLSFLRLVQTLRRGQFLDVCQDAYMELAAAVEEHANAGSMTIKIGMKKNAAGEIEVVPTIDVKPPRRQVERGIYFSDPNTGQLTQSDPNQGDMLDELDRARKDMA